MDTVTAHQGKRTDRNNSRSIRTAATKDMENDLRRGWNMIALIGRLFGSDRAA